MILHALFSACFAFGMIEVIQWQHWNIHLGLLEKPLFNRKPFNCSYCLASWTGLSTGLLNGYGWQSIEIMFISGITGLVLDGVIKKYL